MFKESTPYTRDVGRNSNISKPRIVDTLLKNVILLKKITENVNKPSKRQEFDLYDRHVRFHGSSSVINCDRLWMPKQMLLRHNLLIALNIPNHRLLPPLITWA